MEMGGVGVIVMYRVVLYAHDGYDLMVFHTARCIKVFRLV